MVFWVSAFVPFCATRIGAAFFRPLIFPCGSYILIGVREIFAEVYGVSTAEALRNIRNR